jgi:hypothetical protein
MTDRALALSNIVLPMENALLSEALKLDPNVVRRGEDQHFKWSRDDTPGYSATFWAIGVDVYAGRRALQRKYAWAIPNEAALAVLVESSPIIEIGAGTGYWAALASSRGCDVVAVDENPGRNNWCNHAPYFDVVKGSTEHVNRHRDRTLFLCWPPMTSMARSALGQYRGQRVVFVGEGEGGCCADDDFFALLAKRYELARTVDIPQWWGLNDYMAIYERKNP